MTVSQKSLLFASLTLTILVAGCYWGIYFFTSSSPDERYTSGPSLTTGQSAVIAQFRDTRRFDGVIKSVSVYTEDPEARHLTIQAEVPDITRIPEDTSNAVVPVKTELYTVRVGENTRLPKNITARALSAGMFVRVDSAGDIYESTHIEAEGVTVLFGDLGLAQN